MIKFHVSSLLNFPSEYIMIS